MAWQAGNAAFMRNWPYAFANAVEAGMDFDFVPLPIGDSGRAGGCLGGWQLAVSQYSNNPEAAAAVVRHFTSYEQMVYRVLVTTQLPTRPDTYEDERVLEIPLFAGGLLGDVVATAVARPSSITAERYNEASTLFFSAVHSVLTGSQDAEEAMADLEAGLQELLEEMGISAS